jgi:hypothetical protein
VLDSDVPLFKYFASQPGVDLLESGQLLVTPPKYFNDPFEFSPIVRCKDPAAHARKTFDDLITSPRYFEQNRHHFPKARTFEEFRCELLLHETERLKQLEDGVRQTDQQLQQDLLELLSSSFGVVCFASDPVHPLMWAHYASGHSGMVIEFDSHHPLFSGPSFFQMDYSDAPVTYDASDVPSRAGVEVFMKRKALHWQHEGESRLILRLADMTRQATPAGERFFLPLTTDLITSVTMGLRVSSDVRARADAVINRPEFRHVKRFHIVSDAQTQVLRRVVI